MRKIARQKLPLVASFEPLKQFTLPDRVVAQQFFSHVLWRKSSFDPKKEVQVEHEAPLLFYGPVVTIRVTISTRLSGLVAKDVFQKGLYHVIKKSCGRDGVAADHPCTICVWQRYGIESLVRARIINAYGMTIVGRRQSDIPVRGTEATDAGSSITV